jgi:hypothetical protein
MGAAHLVGPAGQKVYNLQVRPESLVEKIRKEIGILEIGKHPQVDGNAQGYHDLLPGPFPEMINGQSYQVIREGGKDQEQKKQSAGLIVKEQAYQEKVGIPQGPFLIQNGINSKGHQQEYPEI